MTRQVSRRDLQRSRTPARTSTPSRVPSPRSRAEPAEPLDVRLHAPTPEAVIVWVAGRLHRANAPLLAQRVRQQLHRAPHVIVDVSAARCEDAGALRWLDSVRDQARNCGTRLHIAGVADDAIAEPLRRLGLDGQLATGPADAVLAALPGVPQGPTRCHAGETGSEVAGG